MPYRRNHPQATSDAGPLRLMKTDMIGHTRFGQAASGIDVAVDAPHRTLMPVEVEGAEFREEVHPRIRQVIVDPPCQLPPVARSVKAIPHRGHDDARRGAHMTTGIAPVPDVAGMAVLVERAIIARPAGAHHPVAQRVDLTVAIGAADRDAAEAILQRREQLLAQLGARGDRETGIVGQVAEAMDRGDLGIEEIAHEEGFRQPRAAEVAERGDAGGRSHGISRLRVSKRASPISPAWRCAKRTTATATTAQNSRLDAGRSRSSGRWKSRPRYSAAAAPVASTTPAPLRAGVISGSGRGRSRSGASHISTFLSPQKIGRAKPEGRCTAV